MLRSVFPQRCWPQEVEQGTQTEEREKERGVEAGGKPGGRIRSPSNVLWQRKERRRKRRGRILLSINKLHSSSVWESVIPSFIHPALLSSHANQQRWNSQMTHSDECYNKQELLKTISHHVRFNPRCAGTLLRNSLLSIQRKSVVMNRSVDL